MYSKKTHLKSIVSLKNNLLIKVRTIYSYSLIAGIFSTKILKIRNFFKKRNKVFINFLSQKPDRQFRCINRNNSWNYTRINNFQYLFFLIFSKIRLKKRKSFWISNFLQKFPLSIWYIMSGSNSCYSFGSQEIKKIIKNLFWVSLCRNSY